MKRLIAAAALLATSAGAGVAQDVEKGANAFKVCMACRAVQRSLLKSHGKSGFETAERCGVAVLGDRVGLVDPQNIVGEAAHSREDAWICPDARGVFT